jgi:hypothetical protein
MLAGRMLQLSNSEAAARFTFDFGEVRTQSQLGQRAVAAKKQGRWPQAGRC